MLISFIIPTYRRAKNLRRCLASVLADPDPRIEVVVNDNASPDETPAVVAEFAADPRIRYHRNLENIGMPRNVLETMRRAQGEYLFVLTDDDRLRAGAIPALRAALRANPMVGYVFSPVVSVREADERVIGGISPFDRDRRISPGPGAALLAGRTAYILSRQVIRRDAIDFAWFAKAVANAYFPCMVAAEIALRFPVLYVAEPMVWHCVNNVQHWNEFGKNWREIYHRTHMDYLDALRDTFRYHQLTAPRQVDRWQRQGVCDYSRLPVALGPFGMLVGRGIRSGCQALSARVPRRLMPLLILITVSACVQWTIREAARSALAILRSRGTVASMRRPQ
jgi:glycosyltransferase involved in cell wall biosynthesis